HGFCDSILFAPVAVSANESRKIVSPSVRETAFCCPHCDVLTTQHWYDLLANQREGDKPPFIPSASHRAQIEADLTMDAEEREAMLGFIDRRLLGMVYFDSSASGKYGNLPVVNLHLSKCYNCKKIAVWVFDRLVFPLKKSGVKPNPDLPDDVILDFEEAREIV